MNMNENRSKFSDVLLATFVTVIVFLFIGLFIMVHNALNSKSADDDKGIHIEDYSIGVVLDEVYVSGISDGEYKYFVSIIGSDSENIVASSGRNRIEKDTLAIVLNTKDGLKLLPITQDIKSHFDALDLDYLKREYQAIILIHKDVLYGLAEYYENKHGIPFEWDDYKSWAESYRESLHEAIKAFEDYNRLR
jgi:hypothetical protein